MQSRSSAVAIAAIAMACSLAGCAPVTAPGDASVSRVQLYSSLQELTEDSDIVVVGSVTSQEVVQDIDAGTDFTISTVLVTDVVHSVDSLASGSTAEVRQIGSGSQPAPTPLLSTDGTYLLYLTASGLDAPLDAQFYITGANAGVYRSSTDSARAIDSQEAFEQVDPHPGEALPVETNLEEARASSD